MKRYLKFVIPGKPIAKNRPRFAKRGKKTITYSDQETEEGKFMIQLMNQLPRDFKPFAKGVPLSIDCFCFMPIPKSSKKKEAMMLNGEMLHTKRPDWDNLIKFVKDCCNTIVWHDDSQVAKGRCEKIYSHEPRTLFFVNQLL